MCAVTVSGIVELALDFTAHASAEVQVAGVVGRSLWAALGHFGVRVPAGGARVRML